MSKLKTIKDKRDIAIFALILLLGFVFYKDALVSEFQYDDYTAIVNNPLIKHLNPSLVWESNPSRFLTNFTFALNYFVGGLNTFGWHVVNLIIHAVNAFLVFKLSRLLLQAPKLKNAYDHSAQFRLAFFTSLIFLLHPVQTQAVIYVVQRATLLATTFYLGALYLYVTARMKNDFHTLIKAVVCCLLGMFTKPLYITFPLIVVLTDILLLKQPSQGKNRTTMFVLLNLPLIVIPVFLMGTDHLRELAVSGFQVASYKSHLLTQSLVIPTYIKLFFVPIGLNLDHDFPIVNSAAQLPVLFSIAFFIILFIITAKILRTHRLMVYAVCWFFITLTPVIIFPFPDVIFEHWVYLPSFGFLFLVCLVLERVLKSKKVFTASMIVILSGLSFLTYSRALVWVDAITLMKDTVNKSPQKARPRNNLGNVYYRKGMLEEAKEQFKTAIALDNTYHVAHNNLAYLYLEEGDLKRAEDIFKQLIQTAPDYADPYISLGMIYLKKRNYDESIRFFNIARRLKPNSSAIYIGLGNLYQNVGNYGAAKREYQRAVWLKPESHMAYYNLGNVYIKEKNFYEALFNYNLAVKLKPDLSEAHNNIGNIYYYFNDNHSAIEYYKKAVEADPALAAGYFNLANALHAVDKVADSKQAINTALRLYKEQKQFDKARLIEEKIKTQDVRK